MHKVTALALLALTTLPAFAQSAYTSVVGTVTKADLAAKTFSIKPDKADETIVKFDDRTSFLRIPAGETDIKKAAPAQAAEVGTGDRVLVRVQTANPTGLPARTFVITKQADIAKRQEKTLEEWQTQSVAGLVKSVDPAAKQVTVSVRAGQGPARDVVLDMSGNVDYQRYNADSAKYEPSTFATIQTGDQVRVLGQKNADQSQIKTEAIMSGAFRTIPVQIKSIDLAAKQILAIDLATKKPITIDIKPETTMKKLDDATALMMARRLNPSFQAEGRGGRGQGGQAGQGGEAPAAPQGDNAAAAGAGRGAGRGRGGRGGFDPTRLLESQPSIELNDLKAGEPVVVTGTASNDMSKLTAMTLVSGVDPILRAAPANGPDPLGGNWNFGEVGAPQ
jgi:Cu/Ag efflux protein CusF